MKKNKRGVTLVELIICCAIIVMLGGACSAVIASGATVFNQSSRTANAQLDADVLQTLLLNSLPSTSSFQQVTLENAMESTDGTCLFFDEDETFTISSNGKLTTICSITGFTYSVIRAGDDGSPYARAQLQYTVTLTDGSSFNGGFVLSNLVCTSTLSGDLEDNPIKFN